VLQLDATQELPFSDGCFDSVLVDAPCTGTGTIRHNPEIRYRVNNEDIQAKQEKQRRILENASKAVKLGGSLIYATCSLEREENEEVVSSFLTGNKKFALRKPNAPGQFIQESGYLRTFPTDFEGDGFFMATFTRNAE
jgi:16S rRNA (cytosine967-C5)-methyltransferase